jgi:class 3 adenylate cyclase
MDPGGRDELRPVTSLFADVVGSTALGERLPPDEVKALIGECVNRMSAAAEEFGGFVQAYQGDGICVFFGVPAAHEDDPERAALAALRIIELVGEHARDVAAAWGIDRFDVRVGVNTGTAAVGMVGSEAPHPVALGDVTNTAARLQAAAAPGSILVGKTTAKRLHGRFVLEQAGPFTLKGKEEPVEAWTLVEARSMAAVTPQAPLVGRGEELARIGEVLADLERGRGQVLVVTGPAGIGKTRLLDEARRGSDGVAWLAGQGRAYGGDAVYGPFVEMLRAWLETPPGTPEIVVRTRLRARAVPLVGEDAATAFAALLGVPVASGTPAPEALVGWVEALAAQHPVGVVIDDAQWIDAPAREMAEQLLALSERLPVLVVVAMRPEPGSEGGRLRLHAAAEHGHRTTELHVGPLADAAGVALARMLLPVGDDESRLGLVREAEGIPLYLEEIVRATVESGGARGRSWTVTVTPGGGLPPALESLLVARIDRLPADARDVLQHAAVLGRTFPVAVLRSMTGEACDAALTLLLRAEIVREVRRFPVFECAFTHGLLHDATLATLTGAHRRELYRAAAEALEADADADPGERLELLAECWTRADDFPRALDYLERAAARADGLGATAQAAELRRRAGKVAARIGAA